MGELLQRRARLAGVVLAVLGLVTATTGCRGAQEFRAASAASLQSGFNSIAQGLIDGLFAAYTPDSTDTSQ